MAKTPSKTAPAKKPAKSKNVPPAGLIFADAGFHIAVLNALRDADLVSESAVEKHLKGIGKAVADLDEDAMEERLGVVLERLHALALDPAKVAKIEALDFDGGNEIYMSLEEAAETYSGGETSVYSVRSFEGISALTALARLDIDSHGCPDEGELADLGPLASHPALEDLTLFCDCRNADALLSIPKLKRVRVFSTNRVEPLGVLEELSKRGVAVGAAERLEWCAAFPRP
jgi:hypothetical protein